MAMTAVVKRNDFTCSLFFLLQLDGQTASKMTWESGMVDEKSYWKGLNHNYGNRTTKYQGEWVHGMEQGSDETK